MNQKNNQMRQVWPQLQRWPQRWPRQKWPWPQATHNLWPEA